MDDARLGALIMASHREGRGRYGSPRVLDDLREWGERVSRKRVVRLMKERNLVGEMKKRWRHPSSAPSDAIVAPNTLDRAFNVPEPNRVWASDITYVRTHEGWLYLAVVIDLFSRRVVGWSIQSSMHTDIVLAALTMAVGQRLPGPGLLQHSDRGSQLQRPGQLLGQCGRREQDHSDKESAVLFRGRARSPCATIVSAALSVGLDSRARRCRRLDRAAEN